MPNDQDSQELQEEKDVRARAMNAGVIAAGVAALMMVGVAMWYAAVPSNPAAGQSTAAPTSSPGTVGQAPQTPAPAQTSR
jgi:hypothetical protein